MRVHYDLLNRVSVQTYNPETENISITLVLLHSKHIHKILNLNIATMLIFSFAISIKFSILSKYKF